jgi:hypothetical protein
MTKSALKRAGMLAAPIALAVGLTGSSLAGALQTGSKPCYKLVMVPT